MLGVTSKKQQAVVVLICSAILAIGIALHKATKEPRFQQAETVTYSTSTPDENKPGDNYKWKGQANDPKKISIPSINTDSYIQNVGVDQNKEVAVPNNVHVAGWFIDSVRPGQKGLSIIDGHVNGRVQEGVFKKLPDVHKGDQVIVTFGDGSTKNFKVITTAEVTAEETPSVLFSQDPKVTNQLNLITCVGTFDAKLKRYDKRLVVSTELVQTR